MTNVGTALGHMLQLLLQCCWARHAEASLLVMVDGVMEELGGEGLAGWGKDNKQGVGVAFGKGGGLELLCGVQQV